MNAGDLIAGRFVLTRQIGAGGLGVVWSATAPNGRSVAVKFLKSPTGKAIRRFEAEAKALARLNHPACVALIEFGRGNDSTPFIVMEHVPGDTLSTLRGDWREVGEVLDILEQLLRALDHAHGRGIAHRDLKPENVVITPSGRLKVLDFGLAKLTQLDSSNLTETGEVFGTPIYMSPEQLRGSRHAGPASDIYALGAMAFELLTGKPPYSGDSMLELAMGHLGQIPPEIDRPDCPIELKQLVADMLAKDVADRPTAAQALALINPEATQDAHPMDGRPRRDPRVIIAALIAVATVMIALALWLADSEDEEPPKSVRTPVPTTAEPLEPDVDEPAPVPTIAERTSEPTCRPHSPGLHLLTPSLGTTWRYYVPEKNDARPRAVIVVLPNDSITAERMLEDSGLIAQAEARGFLLLAFDGTVKRHIDSIRNQTLDAIDDLDSKSCVDRQRLYVIGHGSGGNSASAVGCMPEIAAVVTASYAPDPGVPFYGCTDPKPKPILHLGPRKSGHAPFRGGPRCGGLTSAMSNDDYTSAWRERNGCGKRSRESSHVDGTCTTWTDCAAPLTACEIDGGHEWPGTASNDLIPDCVGPPSDFPSTKLAVDFLLRQRRRSKGCGNDFVPEPTHSYPVKVGGKEQQLWMAVPTDYDPNQPYPTILVVGSAHGESRAKFDEEALDAGYILVAPMPATQDAPPADEEFLRDAIDIASDSLCIDRSRVFGISDSDGATRLQKLACERPFAGLALTGVAELDPPEACKLPKPATETRLFDLPFEQKVLPFFDKHGQPIP